MLNLLKLPEEILDRIIALGDPLPSRTVTERQLRHLTPAEGKCDKIELPRMVSAADPPLSGKHGEKRLLE
jgi:hypothetical protein